MTQSKVVALSLELAPVMAGAATSQRTVATKAPGAARLLLSTYPVAHTHVKDLNLLRCTLISEDARSGGVSSRIIRELNLLCYFRYGFIGKTSTINLACHT